MSVLLSHQGPALIHGDLTAPVLILTPDTAPCPTCGTHADDVTALAGDGPMEATMIGDTAHGIGRLEPCGHQIGGMTTDAAMSETGGDT